MDHSVSRRSALRKTLLAAAGAGALTGAAATPVAAGGAETHIAVGTWIGVNRHPPRHLALLGLTFLLLDAALSLRV